METILNIGVIGLGRIGQIHLSALKALKNINITAVSDTSPELARKTAEKNRIPKFYTDYHNVLHQQDIDAVWICSPTSYHMAQVREALENNKYVFCEKPLDKDRTKIQSLINSYPDLSRRLMIGFNRRFDPDFAAAKASIKKIGKPTIIKITSRDPFPPSTEYSRLSGGIYNDMSIHDLDMACFISESDAEQVIAIGSKNYTKDTDTTLITIKFKNGIICNIDNSRKASYGYDQRLEILGDKGMISVENKRVNHLCYYSENSMESSVFEPFFLERYKESYIEEAKAFITSIKEKKEFPSTAEDALKASVLANACEQSLEKQKLIFL
ncbi:inositol 2-dehydrogenase [Chryseobacterium phosphatilyticum]|uniref:Inositol 2-dehydrogenase n=1 Tax=Chryseobacterium phosphatilyticum TaxID=475075 RepID=A0A316WVA3_9FLAO|nr:Gfo/Idh/MocA family oxidoreductase [Chryseobacterium phosphatilyticum]PWN65105.1 inositol 2-dehydrogenase [Chryseobacterium phosphatilyticum]